MKFGKRVGIFLVALAAAIVIGIGTDNNESAQLRIGFDIDDTVLFSRDIFSNLPADKIDPIDFGWVNTKDREYSLLIEPAAELIHFFRAHGHEIFFITARPGENGDQVGEFLTEKLGFKITKGKNLFFEPKEERGGFRYTTKHRRLKKLDIDIYYGDSDSDINAAIKAGVHPVRVIRHQSSVEQYGKNYFGDTTDGKTREAPFSNDDLKKFYRASVGVFGESIYPVIWDGPANDTKTELDL